MSEPGFSEHGFGDSWNVFCHALTRRPHSHCLHPYTSSLIFTKDEGAICLCITHSARCRFSLSAHLSCSVHLCLPGPLLQGLEGRVWALTTVSDEEHRAFPPERLSSPSGSPPSLLRIFLNFHLPVISWYFTPYSGYLIWCPLAGLFPSVFLVWATH